MTWDRFREHVTGTAHRIMHYSHQSPVHHLGGRVTSRAEELLAELRELGHPTDKIEGEVLAVGKRLCANCGKSHPGPCRAPKVFVDERKCWNCGESGHVRAKCPKASQNPGAQRPVRSVEAQDSNAGDVAWFGVVSHAERASGWSVARGRNAKSGRPMPTQTTLGDFIMPNVKNRFHGLDVEEDTPRLNTKWSHYIDETAKSSEDRNNSRDMLNHMTVEENLQSF